MFRLGRYCIACLSELKPDQRRDAHFCQGQRIPAPRPRGAATPGQVLDTPSKLVTSPCYRCWENAKKAALGLNDRMKELYNSFKPIVSIAAWYFVLISKDDELYRFPATDRP